LSDFLRGETPTVETTRCPCSRPACAVDRARRKALSSQTTMAVTGHLAQVTTSRPGSRARDVGPDQTIGSVRTQSALSPHSVRKTFIKARSLPSTADGITAGQRHYWSSKCRSGTPRNRTRRTDRLIRLSAADLRPRHSGEGLSPQQVRKKTRQNRIYHRTGRSSESGHKWLQVSRGGRVHQFW
jgi:hypothetical protein